MAGFLTFFIPIALLATAGVLFAGIVGLMRGGEFNRKYSNVLMRWRIGLQAVAVAIVMLALWLSGR
jgi:uncharacterized membrane protein YqgA involved in biofilm formation